MKASITIMGAGGHGKVVSDTIKSLKKYMVFGFVDKQLPMGTKVIGDAKVIFSQKVFETIAGRLDFLVDTICNIEKRGKIFKKHVNLFKQAIIFHCLSAIGSSIEIIKSTVVLAQTTINVLCKIIKDFILNLGLIIDLECNLGNQVYHIFGTIITNNNEIADLYISSLDQIIKPSNDINH